MDLTAASWKQRSLVKRLAADLPTTLTGARRRTEAPIRSRRPQVRLSDGVVAGLIRDYQAGATLTELARRVHVHRTTLTHRFRQAGVELRPPTAPVLTSAQVQEAARLYADGWSLRRLGERYGCTDDTVRRALRRVGVAMRRPWEHP